jgi:hypothetical protein
MELRRPAVDGATHEIRVGRLEIRRALDDPSDDPLRETRCMRLEDLVDSCGQQVGGRVVGDVAR